MLVNRRDSIETTVKLEATAIAEFHKRGFVIAPQLSTVGELALLQVVFARLFAERAGRKEGAQYDLLGHDSDQGTAALPTIVNPVNYAPELRRLRLRENAAAIARQLLGSKATNTFEHVILKPPRQGGATPWHQDEAYRPDSDFAYQQVSIWVPLQDVTQENGCMMYMPESHLQGVLPHRSPGNDPRVHAIECAGEFDENRAIACPLSAGQATIHHGRTLHFAGPNRTDAPRFAYILIFELPPAPMREQRDFYWNREKQAAGMLRKQRWRGRGGIVVEVVRRLRSGVWSQAGRFPFEVQRAFQVISTLIRRR